MALRSLFGAQHQFLPVGDVGEAGPDLRTVDDQFVALDPSAGLDPRKVRTRPGFGEALAPDRLALEDAGQVVFLLRLAGVDDQRRPAVVHAHEVGADPRGVGLGVFLQPDHLLDDRQAAPAVLDRPVDPGPAGIEQAALPGLVEANRIGGVHGPLFGGDIGVEPVAAFLAEALLLG
jgi:hypothetical protein